MLSMLMVVALSAFMRHDAAGIGCVPWPGCYGQNPAAGAPAPHNAGIVAARIAHRVFASFVLLAAIAMLAMSARARPRLHREALLSGALLVLALGLAVLGIFTPGARQPVVAIGNLLGGFLMLALAVRLAIPRGGAGMGPPAIVAAALLLCQDAGRAGQRVAGRTVV